MWDTYEQMRIYDGIAPDQVMYSLMIRACAEVRGPLFLSSIYLHMETRQESMMLIMMMSFVFLIPKRREVERAFNIFDEMEIAQMQPTSFAYNTLIYACARRAGKECPVLTHSISKCANLFLKRLLQRGFHHSREDEGSGFYTRYRNMELNSLCFIPCGRL